MSDQEKAQRLLDRASRKLPTMERAFLETIAELQNGTAIGPTARGWLERLCTEFAEYLK